MNKNLFRSTVAHLAAHFSFPELLAAEVKSEQGYFSITQDVTPTGQAALVWSRAVVTVELHGVNLRVSISYNHPDGGSNGYTARFMVMTRSSYGNDPLFNGIVPLHHVEQIQQELVENQCKHREEAR